MNQEIIATFKKNALEEVRISLDEFKGQKLLNIRVWVKGNSGEFFPTKKGLALSVHQFSDLMAGLKKVKEKLDER